MEHYAISTTRDDHVKQEIINSLVDHEYEIEDDFHSARTTGKNEKMLRLGMVQAHCLS